MACCIVAAFLVAQLMALLRRCGVFWGLLPTPAGEVADTAYTRLAAWARKPAIRPAIAAALALELGAGGAWLYVEHGRHIAKEADIAGSWLCGEWAAIAAACSETGDRIGTRPVFIEASRNGLGPVRSAE